MKQAKGLCEECLKIGLIVPAEEVHHKIHITPANIDNPNITLNYANLIALCREHHRQLHGVKKKRYQIDEYGRVI